MNRTRRRAAFTLLEVLLVIVILVTLAALVVPNFMGAGEKAKVDATKLQLANFEKALDIFRMNVGRYPTSDEGLEALIDEEVLEEETDQEKWAGPYLKGSSVPKDEWGNDWEYTSPGDINEEGYDLYSYGPDGEEDTEDDIKNWQDDEE